ncbi:FAD-dependent oxidoreductase [Pigmentiphaga sp. NML080357]|uniref:NAD(P)/FAD-dependent oxidoreductase n=1 Tax=Pigmentiphaga sp. NML080357 TaxID=2008675 RepID=UPI000B41EACA|nr:FAD-dependent oxidoreductase [Pigmentiphaga sp. NML080357]OVZ57304.1 FAD-dependent oxidoreductase [Pigmentiphaga sp. NML080357]
MKSGALHRIVIAGGGAGGLELAVRLGRRHGPDHVTLVDATPFHIWKPSLHEVAAGTVDIHRDGLSYAMLAHDNGFRFVLGEITEVDRQAREVRVAALSDADGGLILPERGVPYDTLVLAIGSLGNFFNTPGAEQYAISLDTTDAAERFRLELLKAMARASAGTDVATPGVVNVVIVGGGATGVELAAELHEAGRTISAYGLPGMTPDKLRITLIEGGPRILGPLPERVARAAEALLVERGVQVVADCRVSQVTPHSVVAQDKVFDADLCVWAAGIKAPALMGRLGLELNGMQQIKVDETLRTADPAIYAIGDCAAAPWRETGKTVPARAQAAHQQASYLAPILSARIRGETPPAQPFRFRDFGSLVSIGHAEGVGSLMGNLSGRKLLVEGWIARMMYAGTHWSHYAAVLGWWGASLRSLSRLLSRRSQPRVKLH